MGFRIESTYNIEDLPIGSYFSFSTDSNRQVYKIIGPAEDGSFPVDDVVSGMPYTTPRGTSVVLVSVPDDYIGAEPTPKIIHDKESEWLPEGFTSRAQWKRYCGYRD